MKRLVVGITAHVDSGKTTLSEALLYRTGEIRKLGRVDHQTAFLDTHPMERDRGITIFAHQASIDYGGASYTLLDTPGHVDFSAETERTMQVLDYAILVISGTDGVQSHTETLWKLLERYHVPVFLFVNKMDLAGADRAAVLEQLQTRLSSRCVDFSRDGSDGFYEQAALLEESWMDTYLEQGSIAPEQLARGVAARKIIPCYFGAALKLEGVDEFLEGLHRYTLEQAYPAQFGARVFKIASDEKGNRLSYLKITGGRLRVRDGISYAASNGKEMQEKISQIRIYAGAKFETRDAAPAGTVCAVTGLSRTFIGQGLGSAADGIAPVLEPVLRYGVQLPEGVHPTDALKQLAQLEEEDPALHVVWNDHAGQIQMQLMGEVQLEVLQRLIAQRFGMEVQFDAGQITYKETIAAPVEGVGHYEPLCHYAEVHLLLEPLPQGSGLQFRTSCREDDLDRNWQRLVLTHLEEKEHKGVLTGSVITDMKITLTSGKAHLKHTEGGDFRQATYRAVRQGLKKAESVLLEPYYEFRIELPSENVGRAMTDIQNRFGKFEAPETLGEMTVLTGIAPVSTLSGYQKDVIAYTGGRGRISLTLKGYDLCHNQEEVVAARGYDSELDLANPTGSVFCAHGAGFVVDWDEVEEYMHMERTLDQTGEEGLAEVTLPKRRHSSIELTQEELDAIYVRTPDPVKQNHGPVTVCAKEKDREPGSAYTDPKWERRRREKEVRQEYLLVDGYNIIFSWEELRELSEKDIGAARGKLADILSNYQGYRKCTLILVYDAYKVEGNPGEVMKYHNIYIVYTKEAETADQYIEKTVRRIAKDAAVTVATSDGLEQVIILGQGANRMSAPGLKEEIERTLAEVRGEHLGKKGSVGNYLFDYLDEETAEEMEKVRLGKAGKNGRDKK